MNGEYVPIPMVTELDGVLRGFNDVLGLELHWGRDTLYFWAPTTEGYLPDLTGAKAQRDAEAEERVRQLESESIGSQLLTGEDFVLIEDR